jgi:hypothetical protein
VAILLHIGPLAAGHLPTARGLWACHRNDETDFDGIFFKGRAVCRDACDSDQQWSEVFPGPTERDHASSRFQIGNGHRMPGERHLRLETARRRLGDCLDMGWIYIQRGLN